MHKEIADKLVTALRSGEYQQTTGKLRDDVGFCCLGVLCSIAIKEGVADPWLAYESLPGVTGYRVDGSSGTLPPSVQEWAGMRTENGTYTNRGDAEWGENCLSDDNDNGKTFNEIADFIMERSAEL